MTLTVDEVRNIRFPMARQPNEDGYRASAVDNFIDRLEVSYAEIVEENQRLKAGGGGGDDGLRDQMASLARDRDQLSAQVADLSARLAAAPAGGDPAVLAGMQARIDELTRANQALQGQLALAPSDQSLQLTQITQQLTQANERAGQVSQQLAQAAQEKAALQAQVGDLQVRLGDLQAQLAARPTTLEGDTRQVVVTTSSEAAPAVVLLVEQTLAQVQVLMDNAKSEIEQRRAEAETEARRLVQSASQQAEELSRRAQVDAGSMQAEANVTAQRLVAEAQARASMIDGEAEQRRSQIFTQLERERGVLSDRIGQLRDFEAQYRQSMSSHLQRQIESLKETEFAPSYRPELLNSTSSPSPLGRM